MSHDDPDEHGWDDIATAISAEPTPVVSTSRDRPCLVVLTGSKIGETVDIGSGLTVGRGGDADFAIPDDGVSRIHLRIERKPNGDVYMIDADSRNGTFVNGERVTETLLHDGDKIYLGTRAILRFSYADYLEANFQKQMYEAALRDALTGLFNRRHMLSQLEQEFVFVERHGTPLTVVMFDIDRFKQLNDQYGHLVGDQVLRGFGAYLGRKVRGADLPARYGGEEFIIVSRGIRAEAGVQMADRIRAGMEQMVLVEEYPDLRVTMSAGVADVPRDGITNASQLIHAADEALYEAKHNGRNRVECYQGPVNKD